MSATAAGSRSALARISGRRLKLAAAAVVVLACVLVAVFAPPWTVKSLDDLNATSAVAGSENLDPAKYVASIWEKRVLPTVRKDAVDLPTLLRELRQNRAATVKKYGNVPSIGGAPAFLVKASGRIVSVDTASLISKAGVAFGSGNKPDAFIQIGPITSGTDVRDALKFINFNQFLNQVQYETVSVEMNSRIRDSVLSKLDPAKLKGKTVQFWGAFTYTGPKNVLVMPVILAVKGA